MELQGNRQLAVTQQQAWDALNDPQVLKACIPGCDKVKATGENQYAVGVAVKIGPVSAKFNGRITLSNVVPPSSYTLTFDGQGGAAGFGKGVSKVALAPKDSGCVLAYDVQAQVGGKIAQVGQRLVDGVAKSMAEDFFKRFDEQMRQRYPQAASAAPGRETPAAPAASIGGKIPEWVWIAGIVAVAAAWWLLR